MQAADDEERADALDPSVAPLEEAALQEDVRAQYFNKRADKALKEAAKEQNDLKKMQVKENAGTETSFKQKLLKRVVNKVVQKVDDGK